MRHLIYTDQAEADLQQIADYVEQETLDEDAAIAFVDRIQDKCAYLAGLPGTLGTSRPDLREDMRSTPFQGYVIFFRYRNELFEVVNVLHGSKDLIAYFGDDG